MLNTFTKLLRSNFRCGRMLYSRTVYGQMEIHL